MYRDSFFILYHSSQFSCCWRFFRAIFEWHDIMNRGKANKPIATMELFMQAVQIGYYSNFLKRMFAIFYILVSIKGISIDTQQYEHNKLAFTSLIRFSIIFECVGIYRQKVILYDVEIRGSCKIIEFRFLRVESFWPIFLLLQMKNLFSRTYFN